MRRSRVVELVCGLLASALGFVALAFTLTAPLGTQAQGCATTVVGSQGASASGCSNVVVQHVSAVQAQGLGSLIPAILIFSLALLALAGFTLVHSTHGGTFALVFLWIYSLLLWGLVVLAILSIGIFFVPSALLALAASISGSLPARRQPRPPAGARPLAA